LNRIDSDLRLGQIAVRMGLILAQDLPNLLREARSGHSEESAGGQNALGQVLLRKRLCTVSDYLYMARQAREEADAEAKAPAARPKTSVAPSLEQLESALTRLESGELDRMEFERLLTSSGEPIPRERATPSRFGRYELISEVARGGMGIVYRARDSRSGAIVALKVMIEADDDEVRLQRFEREAELAAALDHPAIVRIHDAGREDGIPFFTMDLVDGEAFDSLLEKGMPRDEAIRALAQVARGVDHAHQRGIVHRDMKPGNILIDKETRQARVTDFGLARDLQRMTRLTQVGQAVGTPYYMAPEQVRGERDVDGRADIYAIGVMLYEVLTGDIPFDADSPLSLFRKIDREPVVLELDPAKGIDEGIRAIAMRALAKDRSERYARGELLARDLERYLDGQTPRAEPDERGPLPPDGVGRLAIVLAAVAALVLIAAVAIYIRQARERRGREQAREEVRAALAQAEGDRGAAVASLGSSRWLEAHAAAGRAREALQVVETLLAEGGARGQAANDAWQTGRGADLEADLRVAQARALVGLAAGQPDARTRAREAVEAALAERPRDPDVQRVDADLRELVGDDAGALLAIDRALEVEAADGDLLARRGRLCLALGRPADAAAALSDSLRRRPQHPPALVLRARAYLALGRVDAARNDARDAARLAPNEPDPHLALGDVSRARDLVAEAQASYEQAERLAPKDPRPPRAIGELLLGRGAFEEALRAFARAAERGAGWSAGLGRARARAGLLELGEARRETDAALSLVLGGERGRPPGEPVNVPEARTRLLVFSAELALAEGEVDRARDALQAALTSEPLATPTALRAVRVALARLLVDSRRDADGARALVEGKVDLGPDGADSADVLEVRARIAHVRGDVTGARELAERALAATGGSRHPGARRALAAARQATRVDDAARSACAAAWDESIRGHDLGSEWLRRGLERAALGRIDRSGALDAEAERLLQAALRLDHRLTRAWTALAGLRLRRGQLPTAWEAIVQAAALDRCSPELAERMAEVALALRQDEPLRQAIAALEVARDLEGAAPDRLLLLGRCRLSAGDASGALARLDEAARLAPGRFDVEEARADALGALGRADDAAGVVKRVKEARARREELIKDATEERADDPARALRSARDALGQGDPAKDPRARDAAFLVAELEPDLLEALDLVAPALLGDGAGLLDRADAVLASRWGTSPSKEQRRVLVQQARDGKGAHGLAVALAALEDGLAGRADAAWLETGREHAERAVDAVPGSLAAHLARAWLRLHTADAGRARRDLEALSTAVPGAPLVQLALAEALAATGEAERAKAMVARLGDVLPRARERLAASPLLKGL
jgi:tetratricopeptide (TPR) repeat protein